METVTTKIISPAIRLLISGYGLDEKTEVFVRKGNDQWHLSGTFYQSDDYMTTNLQRHLQHLQSQESLTPISST